MIIYLYLYSPRHDITQLSSNLRISDDLTDDVLYHEGTWIIPLKLCRSSSIQVIIFRLKMEFTLRSNW